MGVMIKFKEGLQPSLLREILLPQTYQHPRPWVRDWKTKDKKLEKRQTVLQRAKRNAGLQQGGGPTGPSKKKWAQKKLGPSKNVPNTPRPKGGGQSLQTTLHPPRALKSFPMDVDAGTMGRGSQPRENPHLTKGRGGFTQLSEQRKKKKGPTLIAQKGLASNVSNQGTSADGAAKRRPIPGKRQKQPRVFRDAP